MTPATHVVLGGVVATRVRNLGIALAASFALHFVVDAIYHFEAFYPASVPGKWSYEQTMFLLFAGLAVLGIPLMLWIWRKSRQTWLFGCYAFLMCALVFDPAVEWRLVWAVILSALWCLLMPAASGRRWVLCGFISYLPDYLKKIMPPVARFHTLTHYEPELDLGDWMSLLARGRWRLHVNDRIFDPFYQIGYCLEILIEAAILFGCLYWLARWSVAQPVAQSRDRKGAEAATILRHS